MTQANSFDLVQKIAILNHELTNYLNTLIDFPGISANNYFYLMKLYQEPGITQSDFKALVQLNQSTVTRAVNALIKLGYIRQRPTKDRRSQKLFLTTSGQKVAEALIELLQRINQDLLSTTNVDARLMQIRLHLRQIQCR
ncbi:MarR family transcriptional regulator [Lactobacillus sp. CC-MHH1034]|uniref:MarR family winged helix-turn-helix transcriptional regulator n=1 Tax=Agrilactobacillus fermenti TaxID=2586909 RepID=UPI001E613C58|nr:MarR family transcriptional regulator [Agrilactobacillus fermenti]MCD2257066.1 MarR family transcriptional regulator [Agrilactobacillus fermenti]